MRAIVQTQLGGPEVLELATVDRPVPAIGQIVVRVRAAGINPADQMNRRTGAFGLALPFTLGWDLSGVVAATGPGVTLFQPGDDVFGLLPFPHGSGAYAEYAVGPTRAFVRKPEGLSHAEAAALPLAGLTAWQALTETASTGRDTRLVVTGAAGGVGHLAVQIGVALGADVVAVASERDAALLTDLGAAQVIDYRSDAIAAQIGHADVFLDVIGGNYLEVALSVLDPGGILVSTLPASVPPIADEANQRGVRASGLFVESDRLGLNALVDLVEAGRLRPILAATYRLADASRSHAEKNGPGKVVLTID